MSPWFFVWDTFYLTEAVTVPATVLTVVACIPVARGRFDGWTAGALIAGFTTTILARPFLFSVLLCEVVVALFFGRAWRHRRPVLLGTLGCLLVTTAFGAWQTQTFETIGSGGRIVSVRAQDRLWGRGTSPNYLVVAQEHGMPRCPDVVSALDGRSGADLKVVRNSDCPGYQKWLATGGLSWTDELLGSPVTTMEAFIEPSYWVTVPYLQYSLYDARTSGEQSQHSALWHRLGYFLNVASGGFVFLAGVLALLSGWRRRWWWVYGAISLGGLVAGIFGLWATDGIEYWRHALPFLGSLPVMAMALILDPPTGFGVEPVAP